MPKYLIMANYTQQGVKGLVAEGGTARRGAVQKLAESLGGKVESFYYAFGATDLYTVIDMPDATSALAVSLAVNSSGGATTTTVPLISVEEVDKATKASPAYRAPGA